MTKQPGYELQQNTELPQNTDTNKEKYNTRRDFVKGATVAMASVALTGCGGAGKSSETGAKNPEISYRDPFTIFPDSENEAAIDAENPEAEGEIIEMDFTYPEHLYDENDLDPRGTRELLELRKLNKTFDMDYMDVPSPENLPDAWAKRFAGWLNAGCTPEEVEPYLALDGDTQAQLQATEAFVREQQEKYDDIIYAAITGDIRQQFAGVHKLLCDAHAGVLRHYINRARATGNFNTAAKVAVLEQRQDDGDRPYSFFLNLEVTNETNVEQQDGWLYNIQGFIGISGKPESRTVPTLIGQHGGFIDRNNLTGPRTDDISKVFKDIAKLS